MGLSETNSNKYRTLLKLKHSIKPAAIVLPPAPNDQIVTSLKQHQKYLSAKEIQEVIIRYQEGVSANKLAEIYGCHKTTIRSVLKRNGITVSHSIADKKLLVEKMVSLREAGYGMKQVAQEVGLNYNTVLRYFKTHHDIVYPYFVCAGRHSKRVKDCKMRAVLVDVIERKIEEIYDAYQIPPELKAPLESYLIGIIEKDKQKAETEITSIEREKYQLEHRRKKLLEAHYSDAIPLELLKSEQKQIAKELAAIEREINLHNISYHTAEYAVKSAIELAEDCGMAYRSGSDTYKRLMNQAIFSRFLVSNNSDGVCSVTAEFQPPFNVILEPFKEVFAAINHAKQSHSAQLDELIKKAERHIRNFFECGVSAFDNLDSIESYSTFFKDNSSSKDFLVEARGVEI